MKTSKTGRAHLGLLFAAAIVGAQGSPRAQCSCAEKVPGQSKWVDFEELFLFDACVPMTQPPPFYNDYTSIEKEMLAWDFDLDGDIDVVVAQKYVHDDDGYTAPTATRNLFLRFENGLFTCANNMVQGFNLANSARDITRIDLDADGFMDFVITNTNDEMPRAFRNLGFDPNMNWLGFAELSNWLNTVVVDDPATQNIVEGEWWSCAVAAADIDCDGYEDLAFGDYGPGFSGLTYGDRVFLNHMATTGQFDEITTTSYFAVGPNTGYWHWQGNQGVNFHNTTGIQLVDVDGDGAVDLFRSNGAVGGEVVWNSIACPTLGGPFFGAFAGALAGGSPYMLMMDDVDGDGLYDGYSGGDGCDTVTINNGGPPSTWTSYPVESARLSSFAGNVVAVDLDNDGLLDWAVGDIDQTALICSATAGLGLVRTTRDANGNPVGVADPNELTTPCANPCLDPMQPCKQVIDETWNTSAIYDVVFFDYDGDGYKDMLQATCDGFRFFRMIPFARKDPSCDCDAAVVKLAIDGNPSVSQNALVLEASGAPAFKNGSFFYSFTKLPQGAPSYDGTICIGPSLARLAPIQSDANGDYRYELDLTSGPPASGPSQITPGTTVYFQLQYRDPSGPTGIKYSDVIEVTFWE